MGQKRPLPAETREGVTSTQKPVSKEAEEQCHVPLSHFSKLLRELE